VFGEHTSHCGRTLFTTAQVRHHGGVHLEQFAIERVPTLRYAKMESITTTIASAWVLLVIVVGLAVGVESTTGLIALAIARLFNTEQLPNRASDRFTAQLQRDGSASQQEMKVAY
jgi:hypothetical protein